MPTVAVQGRGLHTPRYKPNESSLLTIVRPTPDGYKPVNPEEMAYEGPDVHNSCYDLPKDAVDVVSVVSNRRRRKLSGVDDRQVTGGSSLEAKLPQSSTDTVRDLSDSIVPGKGWEVRWEKPGTCDGEYHSICGRERHDSCPLLGHHDSQGALVGNEYSGWLVFDIPDVEEGIILIRMVTGLKATDNPRTEGWSSVNNERRTRGTVNEQGKRELEDGIPDDLVFDWAINGKITSWDKATLIEKRSRPQQMVELWTLLDDPNFANKGKVELAIRFRGCGSRCTVGVPHVYWA